MNEIEKAPRILCIYGNPKKGGFVHGCVDHIAAYLEEKGADVDRLVLNESAIRDCAGCFQCLGKGTCPIDDDMAQIIERIRLADGLVTGASVRNGYFSALFKRFYERITYPLGFGLDLKGKHVLAVGAVGVATGRKHLGRLLTFRDFRARASDYLFFRAGVPTRRKVKDAASKLDRSSETFLRAILSNKPLSLMARLCAFLDECSVRRFMFKRNQDHAFDYVIECWREKGLA